MISVSVPCSCGEFIQGRMGSDEALISCPIDIYSLARIKSGKQEKELLEKVKRAIEGTLKYYDIDNSKLENINLEVETPLPYGKGYATSTSEMVAVVVALSEYFKKKITPLEVAKICVEIEPTDSIMFNGIAIFKHLKCELIEKIDLRYSYNIIILELKESIDTVDLRDKGAFDFQREDFSQVFYEFLSALKNDNKEVIKESMMASSLLNQKVLEKKYIREISEMASFYGSIGINIAHSGSIVGVMFEDEENSFTFKKEFESSIYSQLYSRTRKAKVINGGWIINSESGGNNGSDN